MELHQYMSRINDHDDDNIDNEFNAPIELFE